ncbi:MAG: ATP-dependent zinc metalloprotease FtsH [Victivallaceae bacterium]|nr:ATP-dependent zinc metalloprotease FtsH [Victivallaceae bacterium]
MDNEEKKASQEVPPAGEEKKAPPPPRRKPVPEHRNSRSALVWLCVMLLIGGLLLFKDFGESRTEILKQSTFEKYLAEGRIYTANVTAEGDQVFAVEGKMGTEVQPKESGGTANIGRKEIPYRSRVILTAPLAERLRLTEVQIENNHDSLWNFLLVGILPVLLIAGFIYFFSARQMRMNGKGAFDFGKSKARMVPPDELHVTFADIAGADEAKEEISEIVEYLKDPLRFQLVGGKIPKGCLLVGEPGTGKTLMAKAVACEAGVPFFSISGSDFVEMFVGVGASRVRDMFAEARKHLPCLIFIDEIDAVGRSRFSGWGGGHDEREQTLNAMLVEMDGLESRPGVIVLAATNRPDVLDPALLRPGRFDRQVVMDLPDIHGRRQILDVHIRKIKTDASIDLDVISRTTPGFSGADLANLCNEAALLAARRGREAVIQSDLEEARDKVSYGTERRSRKITDRERRLTAYHEAGHTLVALYNEHCTPIHKVTIIPRGRAYLGATFTMPKEDVYTKSRLELLAEMAMCMGGRAAEEQIFGDITTGASADIQHLTAIAKHMVCIYGMSEKIGPAKMGDFSNHPHLRIDGPPADMPSTDTQREIDLEVRRLVNEALDTARATLKEHSEALEKLAQALLAKETLDIVEIRELLGLPTPPDEVPQEASVTTPENTPAVSEEAKGEVSGGSDGQ